MSLLKPMSLLKAAAAVALTGLLMTTTAFAKPEVGKPAPDFTAVDSNGQTVKLSDLKGKTVVLEWTNDGCPFVVKHYSVNNMQKLQKDATSQGVVWVSIISSANGEQGHVTPAQANELTKSRGAAPTNVVLDPEGKVGRLYDAKTTPHMFVVDAKGMLVYMGGIDDKPSSSSADIASSKNFVRAALDDIAAGRPVATAVTRPYGCSVKYSTKQSS